MKLWRTSGTSILFVECIYMYFMYYIPIYKIICLRILGLVIKLTLFVLHFLFLLYWTFSFTLSLQEISKKNKNFWFTFTYRTSLLTKLNDRYNNNYYDKPLKICKPKCKLCFYNNPSFCILLYFTFWIYPKICIL